MPSWVEGGSSRPEAYATLDYFIATVLGKKPEQVRLMLAGDSHHYARYTEIGGDRSLITCGGGGAYLSATHRKADPLTLPPASLHADKVDQPPATSFDRLAAYPPPELSRRMAWRVFDRLPTRNPGLVPLMVGLQALLSYVFLSSMRRSVSGGGSLARRWETLHPSWAALTALRQPTMLVAVLVTVYAMTAFSRQGKSGSRVAGPLHAAAHLGATVVAVWLAAKLPVAAAAPDWVSFWSRLVVSGLLGGGLATLVLASYLFLSSLRGIHLNELFSAQAIEDHKSFLRLHVQADGNLVVHPLAVARVGRSWHVPPASDDEGAPWIEPDEPIDVRLVEPPLTIRREVPA